MGPYIGRRPQLGEAAVISSIVGGEIAESDTLAGDTLVRSVTIGVATGVLTFVLTRVIENIFFGGRK